MKSLTLSQQIERDEGRKNKLYYDTLNIPTIGVGFNLREGLDDEEIDFILNHRIELIKDELEANFPWSKLLDEVRFNVLVNMAYNLGIPRLKGFKLFLAALEAHDYNLASKEMINSVWHSQVPHRSARLAQQVVTGVMI